MTGHGRMDEELCVFKQVGFFCPDELAGEDERVGFRASSCIAIRTCIVHLNCKRPAEYSQRDPTPQSKCCVQRNSHGPPPTQRLLTATALPHLCRNKFLAT